MDDLQASYKKKEEEEEWSDAIDISSRPLPKMAKPQRMTSSSILKTPTSLMPLPPRSRHPMTLTTSTALPPPERRRSLSPPSPPSPPSSFPAPASARVFPYPSVPFC